MKITTLRERVQKAIAEKQQQTDRIAKSNQRQKVTALRRTDGRRSNRCRVNGKVQ